LKRNFNQEKNSPFHRNQKRNKKRGEITFHNFFLLVDSNPLPASAIVSAPKESSVEQTIQRAEGCVTIENRNNETMDVMEIISFSEASHDHIQLLARSCQNCRIYLSGHLIYLYLTVSTPLIPPSLSEQDLLDQQDLNLSQIVRSS
jgi:hypothetical protein